VRQSDSRIPWQRIDWMILVALLFLGGALRFYQLGNVPPGFQFDEAFNALDAEQVLEGNFPLFLPANGGREVLYTYFQAGLISLLGASAWSFRLASALWGTAAVGAAFVLFRQILRRDSRLIATLAAAALAISYWHIHFSHFGIRVITMPVIFSALFGCFFWATEAQERTQRLLGYLLAGVLLGLSVWSNPTGRLAPIVLVAWVAILLWRTPALRTWRIDGPVVGLLVTGAAAFLVFLPLGITFWQNPDFFFGHASEVSVFAGRVSGDQGAIAVLLDNVLHVLGMFSFFGDLEWTHGIPGRPVLDWVIALPFYVGVVIWAMRLFGRERRSDPDRNDPDRNALWLLALWVVVMLAPSVFSDAAPNYSRTLPSLPAALLPIGLGLAWMVRLRWSRAWMGYALAGAILTASLVWTFYDYFVRFPQMEPAYYAYDVDKADALDILRQRSDGHQVYLSPLWATHAPVRWLREGSNIKTLEPAQTLALPAGGGAVYAYTGEEGARAEALAERINRELGGEGQIEVEEIRDKYGKPLLWLVTLAEEEVARLYVALAERYEVNSSGEPVFHDRLDMRFDDAPTLLGATVDTQGAAILEWRAEAPTLRDLTAFAHYIDDEGNRVAQVDRIPGDGSFPTYTWSAGERVIDRLQPNTFAPCTTGQRVRLATGWYEYAADGARRPRLGAPGDVAVVGGFTLPMRPLAEEEIAPAVWLEQVKEAGPLALLGYTLYGDGEMRVGEPGAIDLYYRVQEETAPLAGILRNGDALSHRDFGGALIPPVATQASDAVYCQRVPFFVSSEFTEIDVQLPMRSGKYPVALWLEPASDDSSATWQTVNSAPFFTLSVDATPITPQIPADASRIGALLSKHTSLDGALVGEVADGILPVTLYWSASAAPEYPAVAFVQMLDANQQYITGADVQPEPATRWWTLGETHATQHNLSLPPDLSPGEYSLVAGMYDALTLERLAAVDGDGNFLEQNLVPIDSVRIGKEE